MRQITMALLLALVATSVAAAEPAPATVVKVAKKQPYGKYLTGPDGRTLYLFLGDKPHRSTCYDRCADAWPPFTTTGTPAVGARANDAMIDTIRRKNGRMQITYNGWPLYYFARDKNPGDMKGQDRKAFGAEWYLVSPQGRKVEAGKAGQKHK